MRRLLFAACLFLSPLAQTRPNIYDEMQERINEHEKYYVKWIREFRGCPADLKVPIDPEFANCNPSLMKFDYSAYLSACRAAAKLYHLKDTCADEK